MDNLDDFQTLLEILGIILTLSTQSPILGIAAAIAALFLILRENDDSDGSKNWKERDKEIAPCP